MALPFPSTLIMTLERSKLCSKGTRAANHRTKIEGWCAVGLFLGIVTCVYALTMSSSSRRERVLRPGMLAPDFSLRAVRGGRQSLSALRGYLVLISFLSTRSTVSFNSVDRSRSEIVFLKSMEEQYGAKGLRTLIVDATVIATGNVPSKSELINFTYDWDLNSIPVLEDDPKVSTVGSFAVKLLPTSFLIGQDGCIAQRWDGFAESAQFAFAIQNLLNRGSVAEPVQKVCKETPAEAHFPGMPLGRPLSDRIWVIDGGGTWPSQQPWPVRWLVLSNEPDLHLRVFARVLHDVGQPVKRQVLVDQKMPRLPDDESQRMQPWRSSQDGSLPTAVFLLSGNVLLQYAEGHTSGCLQLNATVTRSNSSVPLYAGEAIIPIR